MSKPVTAAHDATRPRVAGAARLETFVDAAFAFSLTLLVISYNQLPDTVAELREALRRVPTFVACFALIAMFWSSHHRWSRRRAVHDAFDTVLSLALVLVVLVYVYPLRMVISSFLWLLSGGWLPSELGLDPARPLQDAQAAFMIYSLGFGAMSGLMWALNRHALQDGSVVDDDARHEIGTEVGVHFIMLLAAVASIALSLLVLGLEPVAQRRAWWLAGLPMWVYALLGAALPAYAVLRERRRASRGGGPA